jgi:purine nucleosidase
MVRLRLGKQESGPPTTGYWEAGDFTTDKTNRQWICTVTGHPGTWAEKGLTGPQGPQGIQGNPGVQGTQGVKGDPGVINTNTPPSTTSVPWNPTADPTPVISDHDAHSDVEDPMSIRVALALEREGLIDMRAIMSNTSHPYALACWDAILYADGHRGLPLGKSHTANIPTGVGAYVADLGQNYPRDVGVQATGIDAVVLYRTILAGVADCQGTGVNRTGGVVFNGQGFMNNIADLLQSPADGISPLTGVQLVAAKVRYFLCAAGLYPSGSEYNFNKNALSASAGSYVVANWPTSVPIYFFGGQEGWSIFTGSHLQLQSVSTDIIRAEMNLMGTIQAGRYTWGSLCYLSIARGGPWVDPDYTLVRGTNSVDSTTGANTFTTSSNGPHWYMVRAKSDNYYSREVNKLLVPPGVSWPVPDFQKSSVLPNGLTRPLLVGIQDYRDGTWQPADVTKRTHGLAAPKRPVRSTSAVQTNLIGDWHADDLSELADSATVTVWPDRMNNLPLRCTVAGNRPIYHTGAGQIGGRNTLSFDGVRSLVSDPIYTPRELTIYALVRWSTLPAGVQDILSACAFNSGGSTIKAWKLLANTGAVAQATAFRGATGIGAPTAGGLIVNTWHVLVMRQTFQGTYTGVQSSAGSIDTFIDSRATTGTNNLGAGSNIGHYLSLSVGSQYGDSIATSEQLNNAHLSKLRLYDVWHDNATIDAVMAEIAA